MTSDSSDTAPPRGGLLPKLVRFVLTVAIATVLGPLIGGVTFFLLRVAMEIAQSEFDAADIRGLFVLMVVGAYVVGGVIAFVAGTIVAVAALWRQPTFAVIIAATVVANVGYFLVTEPQVFLSAGYPIPFGAFTVTLAFSAFAATVCWLLFRRLLRNP
jgi:hypothetical protein